MVGGGSWQPAVLRLVHLTFSSQSRISIITFCRGPVRGRKVRSGPLPSSLVPEPTRYFLEAIAFLWSFSLSLSLYHIIHSGFSSLPNVLQDSSQPSCIHAQRSGKFFMGYYARTVHTNGIRTGTKHEGDLPRTA